MTDEAFEEVQEFGAIEVRRNSFCMRASEFMQCWHILKGGRGFDSEGAVQGEQMPNVVSVEPGCTPGVVAVVQFYEYLFERWLRAVLRVATAAADPGVHIRTARFRQLEDSVTRDERPSANSADTRKLGNDAEPLLMIS
ncbi:hypothetical protein [Arthrobacter cavernae]|uniref:Uncharacterized protein n=1 Tax=Arthrobacter cavernae TaxID=2817681 RepID=A0A939KM01_9MICC|nr:hypothetical protein [Arthrobacter cavernae]MBO1267793.1 hypothetical protein [Arthrobacter cavernae]